jgi:polysaccharide biosynthesis transport protein
MPSERELLAFQSEREIDQAERLGLETNGYNARRAGKGWMSLGRFFRRNFLLLLMPALTFGGAALYLILKTPEMFSGEFQLLVEPITSPDTVVNPQTRSPSSQQPFDYETLTRLLASANVLDPVIPNIRAQGIEIDIENLQRQLKVQRIGQVPSKTQAETETKLVSVSFEDRQPKTIEVILNEVAKRYLQYGDSERRKSLGGGVEFIEKQLPEVRQRVTALESQIQKLEQTYRISDLDSEGAVLATRSRELESQRQQIQPALKAQQQLKANLEQQLKLTPSQVVAASQVSENPNILAFSQQLQELQAKLSIQSSLLGEQNPELIALKEQIQTVENTLRRETQKVIGATLPSSEVTSGGIPQSQSALQKSLGQQLIATINEIQVLNIQNQALNQASASIDQELREFPAVKRQHTELQSKLAIDRQLLNKLLLDREEFRVRTAQNEVPWQVVKQPTLLKDGRGRLISTANKGWYKIGLATLGGLLLGLGAALLKEKRQDVFYSLDDLKDAVPLNLMGMVPFDQELKSLSRSKGPMPSESDEETDFQFGYPTRMLKVSENVYANLRYLLSEHSPQSLVLGSVMAGDGKTTLAINLSKAVAGMGQRVLLVDANLSVPQLHSRFGLPNFQGLSDILVQEIDPNELIQRSPLYPNLFLLTAGQMSRKASKLLASNQMTYLMEQLQNMFDLVIYDTHHLQGSSGANFLALNAHGLILVVGIQKTRRSAVLKTLERLRNSRIPMNGMVANFVREPIARPEESEFDDVMPHRGDGDVEEDEFEIFRVE